MIEKAVAHAQELHRLARGKVGQGFEWLLCLSAGLLLKDDDFDEHARSKSDKTRCPKADNSNFV